MGREYTRTQKRSLRCRQNKGATGRLGPKHPAFVHGRRSRAMLEATPAELAERFNDLLGDPEMLALRPEIAMAGTRILELWKTAHEGAIDLPALRGPLLRASDAIQDNDLSDAQLQIESALQQLDSEQAREKKWSQLFSSFETLRRLVHTERERLMDLKVMVRLDSMWGLVDKTAQIVTAALEEHVSDPAQRRAVRESIAGKLLLEAQRTRATGGGTGR